MNRLRLFRRGVLAWLGVVVPLLPAAEPVAHVDDPARILSLDPPPAGLLDRRLADYERTSGVRILVRFHAKSPSADDDAQPGVFMHAIATKLGVAQSGVLAVYFADEDDWRVWIGDELTSKWAGRSGTVKELTESGAIHEAKEAFFAATTAATDAAFIALKNSAPTDQPPTPAQRLQLHATAIVEGLIAKFGAQASTSTSNPP